MRFFPDYQNGSAFLERTLERAQPSLGYYPLAALLANTRNNLVITTNFDSLVEDALFIYTDKKAHRHQPRAAGPVHQLQHQPAHHRQAPPGPVL